MNSYNCSMTVDLKAGLICIGIMQGRFPCLWCTWDSRNGLDKVDYPVRSSVHNGRMLSKLVNDHNNNKSCVIMCDGVENYETFAPSLIDYMQLFNPLELHLM